MRQFIAPAALAVGLTALSPYIAEAQWGWTGGGYRYGSPGFTGVGYGDYGGGYGGGYGSYYGNGGHDYEPHWHTTQTPYGYSAWYGNGPHDYVPHQHSYTPYSYQSHNPTWSGFTQSHHPRYPSYYAPW